MSYWDDLLNTPEELALAVTATQRALLPPRTQAGTGVPLAQGLRVTSTATLNGATTVVLTWYDPYGWQTRLAPYNVYVKNAVGSNQAPQLVGSSYAPAKFVVQADSVASLVFVVQTVLTNGQQSTVDASPTCTASSVSPTIDAASLGVKGLWVSGMTLTNNSPGAGSVAWSACTVYKDGVTYSIAGGNTSSRFIYWTVGSGSFTGASSFTPGPTVYLIATNDGGAADVAWDKLAARSIQVGNLAFSLLYGFQTDAVGSQTFDLNANGSTTIVNWTTGTHPYGGALLGVGLRMETILGNTADVYLDITVDGGTTSSFSLMTNGGGAGTQWNGTDVSLAQNMTEGALGAGSVISFSFGIGFTTSLTVAFRVANAPVSSTTMRGSVYTATKLTP